MKNHEQILAKLVAFDTTSSKPNRPCIDFMRNYLDGFKIKSELVANADGSKACLWATVGQGPGGIALAGHSDTVPVKGQDWTSDPFTLTERGGKLYARGSCDMKGFIACALDAAGELSKQQLKKPLHLAFTYNEETDMEGAQQLTAFMKQRGIAPDWTWIGEPTGLRIIDSHKGVAAFTTSIEGIQGHSGQPDKGLNAIELGVKFMDIVLRAAAEKRGKPFANSRFDPPYTTFNLGIVAGGTAENIIAGHCDIHWQARAHPGDDLDATLAGIDKQTAAEIAPRFKAFAPRGGMSTCTCFNIPPLMPSANNPGEKILTRLTGHNRTEAVSFATEAGFFQKIGGHAVVCGPGNIDQAHQADEYVEAAQLESCARLIRQVVAEQV
jgi:acetylornithine deacetylase